MGGDGKIHVTVRKSTSSRRSISLMTPRPSNLTGAEIYSPSSSRNPTSATLISLPCAVEHRNSHKEFLTGGFKVTQTASPNTPLQRYLFRSTQN
ncbi:hypothetical protein KFK09_014322 [Dendrobium nobile]|uniref:Uncharacterized protein n=1 Tax=Dendrobium nobile TaxID=94219 RepID=A0A8T3B9Q6_DENNO|nr:hypothetical protein KFK09_014322 [Dendrobium nobile]